MQSECIDKAQNRFRGVQKHADRFVFQTLQQLPHDCDRVVGRAKRQFDPTVIGRNEFQYLKPVFLETRVGRNDGRCRNHRLVFEFEKILDRQVDVPTIAHILYGLFALVEQQEIVLIDGDFQLVHGGEHLFVKAFGRRDDFAIAVMLARKIGFHILFRDALVHGEQKRVLRFLAENYGDVRLDDDGMACRIYDFAVGRTASRDGFVENRVCGNRGQNIGQALALVNGENFGSHLVICHKNKFSLHPWSAVRSDLVYDRKIDGFI